MRKILLILGILVILVQTTGCSFSTDDGLPYLGSGGYFSNEPKDPGFETISSSGLVGYSSSSVEYGSVTYQGQTYKTVKIGSQTWMAENLNYDVSGSVCYGNNSSNCDTYGRLYDWATAMDLPSSCNSTTCSNQVNAKHRGICPEGWHIPTDAEWTTLTNYVGSSNAGTKLKARSGWSNCGPSGSGNNYLCEDTYGFSALPGGYGNSGGDFSLAGYLGYWWSATQVDASSAYLRYMYYGDTDVGWGYNDKSTLHSVRCLRD